MICPYGCGKLEDCGQTVDKSGVIHRLFSCRECHSNVDIIRFDKDFEPEKVNVPFRTDVLSWRLQ